MQVRPKAQQFRDHACCCIFNETMARLRRYWPTVVGHFDGLKACIFDNTEDPHEEDPFFYRTSVQMAECVERSLCLPLRCQTR